MPEPRFWIGLCSWQTDEPITLGKKQNSAVNGDAIGLLLGIERKHHEQRRTKGMV
jgi:hypothetical protein